jgi:hypothetical protein
MCILEEKQKGGGTVGSKKAEGWRIRRKGGAERVRRRLVTSKVSTNFVSNCLRCCFRPSDYHIISYSGFGIHLIVH